MSSTKTLDKSRQKGQTLKYYEVLLPLALKAKLIYSSEQEFKQGEAVWVPLRSKKQEAVIWKKIQKFKKEGRFKIKQILSRDATRASLSKERIKWLTWLSEYYQYPLGQVVHLSYPPRFKNLKPSLKNKISVASSMLKPKLTEEQIRCLQEIEIQKNFRVHLLHGVTGSGKTEIYFRLIESWIKTGKSVLILVPEIALTPQHIERFSLRFPGEVASFHSGLSSREKNKQWQSVINGEKKILIGPRSALFCPMPHLSWILVDEEHESYFKQEEKLKYHGRDAAVYLGKCLDIPVVLGSATPSLESLWNARQGKYLYHQLKKRVFSTPLPRVEVVDMRKEKESLISKNTLPYWMSRTLYLGIKKTLEQKQQVALFLNRRGESASIFCPSCGYHFYCLNCDISLTQHQGKHLLCHYCNFREEKPEACPECKREELFSFGIGTAGVEQELIKLFPKARIVRVDRDGVKTHKEWAKTLEEIEQREVDIIVGTQMIAKGLDFPYLKLVGFILADQSLNWPDFRSAEKSLQLMIQMAGRSGRRKELGSVILQSYNPNHLVIQALKKGTYLDFTTKELEHRKKYLYPPFGKLSLVRVQSLVSIEALKQAQFYQKKLKNIPNLEVLGPAPAPYFRLRNKYRYHLLLKSSRSGALKEAGLRISELVSSLQGKAVQVHINRDPIYMF